MRRIIHLALATLLLPATLMAQNMYWQVTHNGSGTGQCQLQTNKITLTISPFHIDVEEEAVIAARGSVSWGDASTLEINGQFQLTKGAMIRSMLLWNGNKILKAKLKDRKAADSAYEAVVSRTTRDPALIEYMGNDVYNYQIYPVAINESRRIRILYSIPLQIGDNGPRFQISPAFTVGASQTPTQIPVEIRRAGQTTGAYILTYGDLNKTIQFGATYQIPYSAITTFQYTNWGSPYGTIIKPFVIVPDTIAAKLAFATRIDTGRTAGHYTALFATPPDTITAMINELSNQGTINLEAKVTAGGRTYIADYTSSGYLGIYIKSTAVWDSTVCWTIYNESGRIAGQVKQTYTPKSDSLTTTMLPLIWGAKYSLVEGLGTLGALYGFVDPNMSLLALESDTLPRADADRYADAGVPPLKSGDIILKPSQYPNAPKENIIFEFGTGVMHAAKDRLAALTVRVLANRSIALRLGSTDLASIRVIVLDLAGRVVCRWDNVQVRGGGADITLPASARGCLIMKVYAGKEMVQRKITLP